MASYRQTIKVLLLISFAKPLFVLAKGNTDDDYLRSQLERKYARYGPRSLFAETEAVKIRRSTGDFEDDQEKRVAAATVAAVVSAAAATTQALQSAIQALGSISRKIAIGITNKSPGQMEPLNVYFRSGTSDETLPSTVPPNKAIIFKARKSHGTATGAVGVISLYMPAKRATLCVLYSVPYDTNLYSNWWNVNFYLGSKRADNKIYEELYYDLSPFKPDGYHSRRFSSVNCNVKGYMSGSGTSSLEVTVDCS